MPPAARALLVITLCAGCGQEPPTLDALLARHVADLGGETALRADLSWEGVFERQGRRLRQRTLVRRAPFGFRQEVIAEEPQAPASIAISDGRYVWAPHAAMPATQPGTALPAELARGYLDGALVEGMLYLEPRRRATAALGAPTRLPPRPGLPADLAADVAVIPVAFPGHDGAVVTLYLGAQDGRLHEWTVDRAGQRTWSRNGAWRRWGSLWHPSLCAAGAQGGAVTVLHIEAVRAGGPHSAELFAGCPAAIVGLVPAGRLSVLPHTVPGNAHLVLEDVRINGSSPELALVDTGAGRCAVIPDLLAELQLPVLGGTTLRGFTGAGVAGALCWIDALDFGSRRAIQVVAHAVALPRLAQIYEDRRLGALIGRDELFAGSPVLDLVAGELLLRGAPVRPLTGAVEIPFQRLESGPIVVAVEIDGRTVPALVDTGAEMILRLTRPALLRAHLPVDAQEWLRRGAIPKSVGAAGDATAVELLIQLDSLRLGPVVFRRPIVQVAPDVQHEYAFLGAGALLPFARVGFDLERQMLELEPGSAVERTSGGVLQVAEPGELLGFAVRSPPSSANREPDCLPIVFEVVAESVAYRSGLRPNDRLRAIDGFACAARPAHAINRRLWLRQGQSMTLEVITRGGERRLLRIP